MTYRLLSRNKVSKYEYIGISLAMLGALFVFFDNDITSHEYVDFSNGKLSI